MKVRSKTNGQFIKDNSLPRYKNCEVCGKKYYCRSQFKFDTSRYCSYGCLGQANKERLTGNAPYKMTYKTRIAISKAKKGVQIWGGKREMDWLIGEKNHNWKGGITPQDVLERKRFQHTMQKLVLERDNYTCQLCGNKGDLQVDHIQSWVEYVELRFSIDNCRTLCAKCHYKITYGKEMPENIKGWGHNLLEGIGVVS